MWTMKRVGAPNPSPDGKWVVFSLVEPAYDEKDQVSDLWIVPADASAKPRRLTFSKGGESGVAWSPDSRRLAFSAKREGDEVSQIYVLDVADGGEAVRVTSLSTGARSPQWRPDGKALLFTSTVFPGAADDEANKKIAAERKAQKYKARVYERFPIRNWDKWLEDTQAHLFVQSLEPGAKAKDLLAGTKLVTERGFAGRVHGFRRRVRRRLDAGGRAIVFVATTNRDAAAYANTNYVALQSFRQRRRAGAANDRRQTVSRARVSSGRQSALRHLRRRSERQSLQPRSAGEVFLARTWASRQSSLQTSIARSAVSRSRPTANRST